MGPSSSIVKKTSLRDSVELPQSSRAVRTDIEIPLDRLAGSPPSFNATQKQWNKGEGPGPWEGTRWGQGAPLYQVSGSRDNPEGEVFR